MNIQLEPLRDLSLDAETAERVVGGRRNRSGHHSRPFTGLETSPAVVTSPSEGLGMGPDPGYPNADSGDDGC